jgi:hypothetical protein
MYYRAPSGGFTKHGDPDATQIGAGVETGLSEAFSIHYADEYHQHMEAQRQQRNEAQMAISGIRFVELGPTGSIGRNSGSHYKNIS